ncbi:metal ABC transporter substrate-binding protein [Vogesella sp. LIG4]|uniref:metal ABC transporter substrate-binding protein n=1 Tax=Vogesella sp. LIG4 TaxID=1192162 RepID=UPI00081FC688|nr:metal ABC transporter substrate-binding protein [Vogesella sp. LIG4]SCK26330.1 zinc/manganese transport system substrate-binding protein [Vogesella sp. LIG4]
MRKLLAAALLLSPLLAVAKVPVVASFSIVADITREIGGDKVEVQSLVGPDQDAHVFQPAPADVKKLAAAKVFVVSGLGFEGWMPRMTRAAGFKGLTVTAAAKVKPRAAQEADEHGGIDPHAWHNPQNVMLYAQAIADGLSKADPADSAYFQQRATAYQAKLKQLDDWAAQQFAAVPVGRRKVLTSHDAFGYFAARYQIRFMAPQGISTEAEASAKGVAQLIRQVKAEQVKAVFFENMSDHRLLEQLSKEAGVKVGGKLYADALSNDGKAGSYLQLFRSNVELLLSAMR